MKIDRPGFDGITKFLNGRRFSADQICRAAGINRTSIGNITNKSGLKLASEPQMGRLGRQYCLIDGYLISIFSEIVSYGFGYEKAKEFVEHLYNYDFDPDSGYPPADRDRYICGDIRLAPELFVYRGTGWPVYMVISDLGLNYGRTDEIISIILHLQDDFRVNSYITLNITKILGNFDMKLANVLCQDHPELYEQLQNSYSEEDDSHDMRIKFGFGSKKAWETETDDEQ